MRTRPTSLGHSTALVTTDADDVARLGSTVTERLGLRGVAKLDFKRDDHGRLRLLEINARFTLWHHVGAAAGVNLPALVWADLVGMRRPALTPARPGVRWCRVKSDWAAAREQGIGTIPWLRWVASCETRSGPDPLDPGPFLARRVAVPAYRLLRRPIVLGI